MVATDIKQVWAYSTISQLGFMAMGLAAAGLASGTLFPGYYHLTTHAAFKALLFFCSGVFIHHFGTNDFLSWPGRGREAGDPHGHRHHRRPGPGGDPPFSGILQQGTIMGALGHLPSKFWLAMGLFGAFLTAYYSFRVIFVMLFPKPGAYGKVPGHVEAHPGHGHAHGDATDEHHGVPWVMLFPLIVLALFTLTLGFCEGYPAEFLLGEAGPEALNYFLMAGALCCGVGAASQRPGSIGRARRQVPGIYPKSSVAGGILHTEMVHGPLLALVPQHRDLRHLFPDIYLNDRRVVDGGVDAVALSTVGSGRLLSFVQTAFLQYNLFFMVVVVAGVGIYLLMGR